MFTWLTDIHKDAVVSRTSVEKEEGLVFAIDTSKNKSASGGYIHFIRMRIGYLAAKKAGLKAGDKVTIGCNFETNEGIIRVVAKDEAGWILSGLKRNTSK